MKGKPLFLAVVALCALAGCASKPAPDEAMTTSPAGMWVGSGSDLSLDIQEGGYLKISRNGQETEGTWTRGGDGVLKVTLDGQTFEMPFTRKDLSLSVTLPGETSPTEFTQM